MIEIIPAILPSSFAELESSLGRVQGVAKSVQIDVVDGIFAPNKTWPYAGGEHFSSIVSQEEGLPFWDALDFEFDCMVAHPLEEVGKFIFAGASRLVLHGAGQNLLPVLESLQPERKGEFGVALGVALLPSDETTLFAQYRELADFVQVMGIEKVGFQGSAFDERALALIASLRHEYPELPIQVDGGVKLENVRPLIEAGANRLIVGSAIFKSTDAHEAIHAFQKEVNKSRVQ